MNFRRQSIPGIAGEIIQYQELGEGEVPSGFVMTVSSLGLRFEGNSLPMKEPADLDRFAHTISQAWKDFQRTR